MRTVLLFLSLLAFTVQAQAISRYASTSMSCERVKQTIRRDGAAIMRYTSKRTPGLPLFGRYVRNRDYCEQYESTRLVAIPARDTARCLVRECERVDPDEFLLFRRD